RTAVLFRRPSKAFADQYAAGNTAFMTFPEKPVASEGGVPITVNGKIIGAIGASGGTGQQDGLAAAAGASGGKQAAAGSASHAYLNDQTANRQRQCPGHGRDAAPPARRCHVGRSVRAARQRGKRHARERATGAPKHIETLTFQRRPHVA